MKSIALIPLFIGVVLFAVLGRPTLALAQHAKPLALVWRGPGACKPTCGSSAAKVARLAGFRTLSVYPGFKNEAAFQEATLWVQPGGKSVQAAAAMGPELMERVRRFVYEGGGYVGFCAGMFLSTDRIGTSNQVGLGLIPGRTELYMKDDPSGLMIPIRLKRGTYSMYYAGGPELEVSPEALLASGGEVTARYSDGSIAGVNVQFGKGRVSVVGFHPEASWFWKFFKGNFTLHSQRWLSIQMIRWATQK